MLHKVSKMILDGKKNHIFRQDKKYNQKQEVKKKKMLNTVCSFCAVKGGKNAVVCYLKNNNKFN